MRNQALRVMVVCVAGLCAAVSCFAEPDGSRPAPVAQGGGGAGALAGSPIVTMAGTPDAGGMDAVGANGCISTVLTSEELPARSSVISGDAPPAEQEVFVTDLFGQFRSECGGCHVEASLGGFHVAGAGDFLNKIDQKVLDRIESDDPLQFMPPPPQGVPFKDRPATDPVAKLDDLLHRWIAADKPADLFLIKNNLAGDAPYVFSRELGLGLTNLGTCVPEANFPFASVGNEMDELDAKFAAFEAEDPDKIGYGSPERVLGLPRLLSETDLTSFDSEVLARRGVIAFVPGYPLWSDGSGKLRHIRVPRGEHVRFDKKTQTFKIPTNTRFYKTFLKKVIDSEGEERFRKMETRIIVSRPEVMENGVRVQKSLFGSYKWNEDESQAELVTITQRNLKPFKDLLFSYFPDEVKAQAIRDQKPANLTYEFEFQDALKYYAIPGHDRCVQCHMGSPNQSFVLGFSPLQLHRRKLGQGGVYEDSADDELGQFQRLIDLGVITGLSGDEPITPDDVTPLEDAEGERKPRNDLELRAQGYMYGNCSHCHNPNGYPSAVAPELATLLDFLPRKDGGIFQFPLDRFSPRINRGAQGMPITYITPSLRDVWPGPNWEAEGYPAKGSADNNLAFTFNDAPWRSLLFRNVNTPFAYFEDFTIYPHMPMNTAGHDCRAPHFLGEWMTSIPAKRKHPEKNENFYPVGQKGLLSQTDFDKLVDNDPQPFVEVLPDDPAYDDAVASAGKRVKAFQASANYKGCVDGQDIVDHDLLRATSRGDALSIPADTDLPPDGVPNHAHWVTTDLTDRPGAWEPRRSDWDLVVVGKKLGLDPKAEVPLPPDPTPVVTELRTRFPTQGGFPAFAATPRPIARWLAKDSCKFKSGLKYPDGRAVKTSADYTGQNRPTWMDLARLQDTEPVFEALPGQVVFDMICTNCHGRQADSRGRQASTIQELTGGETRVANLRDGLLGPAAAPGDNLARAFGLAETEVGGGNARDWAMRYVAWMGLGGTQRVIPAPVLGLVARTSVSGTDRPAALISDVGANMLAAAQVACRFALPVEPKPFFLTPQQSMRIVDSGGPLIATNGDAELWQKLCSMDNAAPVRGVVIPLSGVPKLGGVNHLFSGYPVNAPIGNQFGETVLGYDPATNSFPWCLEGSTGGANATRDDFISRMNPPICPDGIQAVSYEDIEAWSIRAAANAGFSVFEFLSAVTQGKLTPVRYDECEFLK